MTWTPDAGPSYWKKRHGVLGGPGKPSEALAWLDKPCPTCGSAAGRNCTTGLPYRRRLKPGQSHMARRPECQHPSVDVKGNEAFCWACRRVFDYAAWQERTVIWSATKGFNPKHPANRNLPPRVCCPTPRWHEHSTDCPLEDPEKDIGRR